MILVPSIIHDRLKFEYQGEVHIVISVTKPYSLCNIVELEEFIIT